MNEGNERSRSDADADLEREIRKDRKFSLSEAIGRLAGPGSMKGASPVTLKRQAESVLEELLREHLPDAAGCLCAVVRRRVGESDLLLANLGQPLVVLAAYVQRALDSEHLLRELVRDADVEWGRVFGERPFFEKEGEAPQVNDPYTPSSVRDALSLLLRGLGSHAA